MTDSQFTTSNPSNSAGAEGPSQSLLWRCLRIPARLLVALMFDLKVYGRHNVPRRGGVLLVSNHQSYLDPVLLAVYLQRPMSYLAKAELFSNRCFAWFIRSLNAFPVRQGAADVAAVKETIRRLRAGHMLSIFPEGSRTEDGRIAAIEPGAALVVRRAHVPIVPVVIEGSFQAWPRGRKFPRSTPISVMYGPPMQVLGLESEQITELIDRTLRSMHAELQRIHNTRRRQCW